MKAESIKLSIILLLFYSPFIIIGYVFYPAMETLGGKLYVILLLIMVLLLFAYIYFVIDRHHSKGELNDSSMDSEQF